MIPLIFCILKVRQTAITRVMAIITTSMIRKKAIMVQSLQLMNKLIEYVMFISTNLPVLLITLVLSIMISKLVSTSSSQDRSVMLMFWAMSIVKFWVQFRQIIGTELRAACETHYEHMPLVVILTMSQFLFWSPSNAARMQQLQKSQFCFGLALGGKIIMLKSMPVLFLFAIEKLSVPQTTLIYGCTLLNVCLCREMANFCRRDPELEIRLIGDEAVLCGGEKLKGRWGDLSECSHYDGYECYYNHEQIVYRLLIFVRVQEISIIFENLTYMQYRYKVSGASQARKSSCNTNQSHKNDTITYINLLDKCTQILREDRIWIRNQLKAGDEEIFRIFKQAKRPLNLQHLQIRLRKYVTGVKSKAKMEQLMKFKQNMNLGDWTHSKDDNTKDNQNQSKRQTLPKYQLPSTFQAGDPESRGMKARMNNSIEKQSKSNMIYPYRGASANSKRTLDHQFPAQMEQITERESQNMTSARHRAFPEDNSANQGFTFSHNYQQWRRPEQNTTNPLNSNFVNDPFKPKAGNQTSYFNNFMPSEKEKIKPQPYTKPSESISKPSQYNKYLGSNLQTQVIKKSYEGGVQNSKKQSHKIMVQKQQRSYEQPKKKQYNLQQHYFDYSNERSNENGSQQSHTNSGSYYQDYSPNIQKPAPQGPAHSNFLDTLSINHKIQEERYKAVEQTYQKQLVVSSKSYLNNSSVKQNIQNVSQETDLMHSKTSSVPFSSGANNDSLFTSPELLAQCRNFLKLKSSAKPSVQKDFTNNRFPVQIQKFQPLRFDHVQPIKPIADNSHSQSSMLNMFNDINCNMVSSMAANHQVFYDQPTSKVVNYTQTIKVTKQVTRQVSRQAPREMQKEIPRQVAKQTKPKQPIREITNQANGQSSSGNSGAYQYFHTFAALSSQKKQQPEVQHQEEHQQHEQSGVIEFSTPESFVDLVFEYITDEPDGYIYWTTLERLTQKICPQFMDTFKQYLLPTDDEQLVLISNIGRLLEDYMQNQDHEDSENDARNIYRLLDIQQKGYIAEQDVQDFIHQLEDSEAEDIDTISQHIWKLFESIDQDAEEAEGKRIDYWGIYSKKNSSDFQELNQILKQFEFQIE